MILSAPRLPLLGCLVHGEPKCPDATSSKGWTQHYWCCSSSQAHSRASKYLLRKWMNDMLSAFRLPITNGCSVVQSCPTLWPHGLQHTRLPCLSPSPDVRANVSIESEQVTINIFKLQGQRKTPTTGNHIFRIKPCKNSGIFAWCLNICKWKSHEDTWIQTHSTAFHNLYASQPATSHIISCLATGVASQPFSPIPFFPPGEGSKAFICGHGTRETLHFGISIPWGVVRA